MATFFFHSGMAGAPTNTNAAGSTLEIIRSCLVTGFNLKSVVSASVASGVMTINYAAPHGYEDKVWLRLDGAAGGSIVQRVTTASGASSLTIPAPGFADGAVSGTLSTRVAPADWEEVFTGTNIGVFRSKVEGPGSTRFFYRVADTVSGSNPPILRGFESMSDANTGIGPFPTFAQNAGNGFPVERPSTARPWVVVADGRTMYLNTKYGPADADCLTYFFGDEQPFSSADLFMAVCAVYVNLSQEGARTRPRISQGTGSAVVGNQRSLFGLTGLAYPSPVDGGLVLMRPVLCHEQGTGTAVRGVVRGLLQTPQLVLSPGQYFAIFSNVTGIEGRVLILRDQSSRCFAFAIDEDWA
jgi:hypothetical protein